MGIYSSVTKSVLHQFMGQCLWFNSGFDLTTGLLALASEVHARQVRIPSSYPAS